MADEEDRWSRHREISDGVLVLDAEDLDQLLPLNRKRILVERVISLQPGLQAVAQKAVTAGDVVTPGRVADFSFPSTSALSALEQLALVIILSAEQVPTSLPSAWRSPDSDQHWMMTEVEVLDVISEMAAPGILHMRATKIEEDEIGVLFEGGVSVEGEDFIRARWRMGTIQN